MQHFFPDVDELYPAPRHPSIAFLKNHITRPNIIVGDYTYYADSDGVEAFERNVRYHFESIGDKLIIGRFCSIAAGTRFLMNGANHRLDWFSNFPFPMFMPDCGLDAASMVHSKGDTVIGNDVWIGNSAVFMPGVRVGDGAIVAAHALVSNTVPPYAVVGGNPAKVIRYRFDDLTIVTLLALTWWDWPVEKIARSVGALCSGNVEALLAAADAR
ncbi:virginiamycin A acetyltransferase [Burkholderia sp. D7]|nr:virginiamycin A acetyltransferase [Burkholderia sp. D7]